MERDGLTLPEHFPEHSPFAEMRLVEQYAEFPAASYLELVTFEATAEQIGHPSVGTAARTGWEWLLRERDILCNLNVDDYRAKSAADYVYLEHGKNEQSVWVNLLDYKDGSPMFPELTAKLDRAAKGRDAGPLIFRDDDWRETGKYVPWDTLLGDGSAFDKIVKQIIKAAGLRPELSFGSFRQGGFTELGEAELTEIEIMHLGRQKSARVMRRYPKRTAKAISNAQRKRKKWRKKSSSPRDGMSTNMSLARSYRRHLVV